MTEITAEQWEKISRRLTLRPDPHDLGQLHGTVARALSAENAADRLELVVDALQEDRVLVPVVINGNNVPEVPVVCVETEFGRAMAVFSSVGTLEHSLPEARPLPVSVRTAALSALVESCGRMILDPQGASILIPRSATLALSIGEKWVSAWRDEELCLQLKEAIMDLASIIDIRVVYGAALDVNVELVVRNDVDQTIARRDVESAVNVLSESPRLQASADRVVIIPIWAHKS